MLTYNQKMRSLKAPCATKVEIRFKDVISFLKSYIPRLSPGGIFVKTEKPLPLESWVLLVIDLPDGSASIEAEGSVVLTNPYGRETCFPRGMGIKFEKIKQEDLERIKAITESNMPKAQKLFIL